MAAEANDPESDVSCFDPGSETMKVSCVDAWSETARCLV